MVRYLSFFSICFFSVLVLSSCSQKFHTYGYDSPIIKGTSSLDMPSEPGKCFARCLIQDQYKATQYETYIYTGDDNENINVKYIEKIKLATTKWEKRKADRNCISTDPEECLVWCLIEVPGETESYYEVLDTNLVKEFELKYREVLELESAGGYTAWKEVVCDSDITPAFYRRVQQSLIDSGYKVGVHGADGRINTMTKAALIEFQKDHSLPIGQLDIETIEKLNLNY